MAGGRKSVGGESAASADGRPLISGHVFGPDMMPLEMVSASLEKDGLTVSITDGPGGLSAVVTNEAGEVLGSFSDGDVDESGLPAGMIYDDERDAFVLSDADGEVLVEIASMEFEMAMNEVYAEVEHDYQEPETVLGYRDGGDWLFAPTSAVFGESAYVMSLTGVNGGFLLSGQVMGDMEAMSEPAEFGPDADGEETFETFETFETPSFAEQGGVRLLLGTISG